MQLNKNLRCRLRLYVFLGIALTHLQAQTTNATIQGTVTDSSGAAVSGAMIQIKNTGTGIVRNNSTDSQGRYHAADLVIGNYEVQISKPGFQAVLRQNITLTVGSQIVADATLTLGQKSETLIVNAEVPQVETTSAAVASLVNQTQMRDLPLNGRNFEQLLSLAPGVQLATNVPGTVLYGQGANYSVAGARPEGQAFLLDNTNVQNFWNHGTGSGMLGTSLGVEAIAEFQTVTNTYGAEYGGSGAVINAVSKSGTNSFHGSAYDFLRNSALDARNFFDPQNIAPFRKNQFGGSLGGPIKKDKTFFFLNYEGLRQLLGETKVAFVPDANAHQGLIPLNGVLTNVGVAPNIASTLALYPLPTSELGGGIGHITNVANQTGHENYVLARFDCTFSPRDSLFLRYVSDRGSLHEPFDSLGSTIPLWPEVNKTANQYATIEEQHLLSPTMINLARFSFVRTVQSSTPTGDTPPLRFTPGRPNGQVSVAGLSTIGSNAFGAINIVQNKFTEADDLLLTHGAHNIRFGGSVDRIQSGISAGVWSGGTWTFDSLLSFLQGNAALLLGVPPGSANSYRSFREIHFTPYFQDGWKISSRLTLNLGLRWDFATNPVEVNNLLYILADPLHGTGFVNTPHVFKSNPAWKNLDPRFGFAYDPFADHKTSIRGGFGIYHDVIEARTYATAYYLTYPYVIATQVFPSYPTPFTSLTPSVPTIPNGIEYNDTATPYLMEYNVNIQHEIASSTVVSVGYVGSGGRHLFSEIDQNPPIPTIGPDGRQRFGYLTPLGISPNTRINPALGYVHNAVAFTDSSYNSLQASLNRRLARDVQAQLSYTYSKCLDTGSGTTGLEGAFRVMDPYNRNLDHGRCGFDVRQAFRVNALYMLPSRGNRLVEGWQLTGIFSFASGVPFPVTDGFDQAGLQDTFPPRPDLVPGCKVVVHQVNEWYDPACFSLQPVGALGNLGRNVFSGPGLVDFDFGLLKTTRIWKLLHAQFRAEFFNIINHPNFGAPSPSVFVRTPGGGGAVNPTAGQITATTTTSRQIQFALKLLF
jgi:hypothetical protein